MTLDELRAHLRNLIDRYVTDDDAKTRLLELVSRPDVPAKGILADLDPFLLGRATAADWDIVKDIAFNFC
jgi:hypothetical protein